MRCLKRREAECCNRTPAPVGRLPLEALGMTLARQRGMQKALPVAVAGTAEKTDGERSERSPIAVGRKPGSGTYPRASARINQASEKIGSLVKKELRLPARAPPTHVQMHCF